MVEKQIKILLNYFFKNELEELESILLNNEKENLDNWLKKRFYESILLIIFVIVLSNYLNFGLTQLLFFIIVSFTLPFFINYIWLFYLEDKRIKEIENYTSDVLLYAASMPKGTPIQKIIRNIGESNYGALSKEFLKASSEIEKGLSVKESLNRILERNKKSEILKRGVSLIIEAYENGNDCTLAFKEVAKDIVETEIIIKERYASTIIERYTILISACIILPAILAMITKIVESISFSTLNNLEIGMSNNLRENLIKAINFAIPIYLLEYCILAAIFVGVEQRKIKKCLIYIIVMIPVCLTTYLGLRTII